MREKIAVFLAKIVWLLLSGTWPDIPDGVRPIDAQINAHWLELQRWNHEQRKEIILSLMKKEWSDGVHVHSNPKKKAA